MTIEVLLALMGGMTVGGIIGLLFLEDIWREGYHEGVSDEIAVFISMLEEQLREVPDNGKPD